MDTIKKVRLNNVNESSACNNNEAEFESNTQKCNCEKECGCKVCNDSNECQTNVDIFKNITHKMVDTYERKNADYGDSFAKSLDTFGLIASVVRLSDKFNRISNLIKSNTDQKVLDESIEDTLLDMATYSVMTLVWLQMNKNK